MVTEVVCYQLQALLAVELFSSFQLVVVTVLTDKSKQEARAPVGMNLKKHTAVSTNEDPSPKAAWTVTPSDMRRLEDIPVLRRQGIEFKEIDAKQLPKAREVGCDAIFSLVREHPVVMAYVTQRAKFLDARRLGSLPSHGRASKFTNAG